MNLVETLAREETLKTMEQVGIVLNQFSPVG